VDGLIIRREWIKKRYLVKAQHLQNGSEKPNTKEKIEEVLENKMISRGLQRIGAQDHKQ